MLRLVKLREYVAAARDGSSSLCYDYLEPSLFIDKPFEELLPTVREDTAVVSWRWPFRKPGTEDGWKSQFSPEDEAAGRAQALPVDLLDTIASATQTWLWIDWGCVPQYGGGNTMKAIELSGIVYREAASMIIWEANAIPGFRVGREYMTRAWTLAERIQRRKKKLTVRDFISVKKLQELEALEARFHALDETGDWDAMTEQLFHALYSLLSASPIGTAPEAVPDPDFLEKAPIELAGLCTANVFEAPVFHLIDQIRVMGPHMQVNVMSDLRGYKDKYEGSCSTGGVDGAMYLKFQATGGKLEDLLAHELHSTAWWRTIAHNVRTVLECVLSAKLVEGSHTGWLIDYICRGAGVEYHAFSKQDLLICLLASGAVADADLDAVKPIKEYADVLERAFKLMGLEGIESQLSLLLLKGEKDVEDAPSWHPVRFFGDLDLSESVYSKWVQPASLADFLTHSQRFARSFGCRANTSVSAVHSSGKQYVCGQAFVQDIDALIHYASWWPVAFAKGGIIEWFNARVNAQAATLATKDWTKALDVDPTPEVAQHVIPSEEEVEPGVMLALRLTFFAPPSGRWFSGTVQYGEVARDLVVEMIWRLDEELQVWKLESRETRLEHVSPCLVNGVDLKGLDPNEFDPVRVVRAGIAQAKLEESLVERALA